ncbi:hypothetical protein QYE76_027799 [Lolium multiflorum]|uniref:CCHC-type domain-containing protein n=1 Tax=Lolium multiflorum TaxID=4521 RepID=A0AAD8QJR9_LOLMU|nr:hypothetical protein QYE76_027799 [Lolium multiflorum]
MASSSSFTPINLGNPSSEKLTRNNFPLWCSMVLPAIRGAQLVGLLDGSDPEPPKELAPTVAEKTVDAQAKPMPNPAYAAWLARDQSVLSYLLQSLSLEILPHVHRIESAAGVWRALAEMFAAQSEARVTNLLVALANTKKLQMTTSEFLTKMQGFADELVSAGHPLQDRQLVSYILAGLGGGYNSLVAALGVATTPITLSMLYSQLHAYDQRQEMLNASPSDEFETSASAASRQRRPQFFSNSGSGKPRDRGDRRDDRRDERRDWRRDERPSSQGRGGGRGPQGGGRGRGRGRRRTTPWVNATCQICNKEGHYAKDCWSRYEEDESYGDKEINTAYGVDTNWYQDCGATHHITGELHNLSMRDTYKGYDKVNTANGQGGNNSSTGSDADSLPVSTSGSEEIFSDRAPDSSSSAAPTTVSGHHSDNSAHHRQASTSRQSEARGGDSPAHSGSSASAFSPATPRSSRSATPSATATPDSPGPSPATAGSVPAAGSSVPPGTAQPAVAPSIRPVTRASKGIVKPREYKDGTVRWILSCTSAEPTNVSDALQDTNWRHAMDEEFDAL